MDLSLLNISIVESKELLLEVRNRVIDFFKIVSAQEETLDSIIEDYMQTHDRGIFYNSTSNTIYITAKVGSTFHFIRLLSLSKFVEDDFEAYFQTFREEKREGAITLLNDLRKMRYTNYKKGANNNGTHN